MHGAMAGRAHFHLHARRQFGGYTKTRSKDLQNQRVTRTNQFNTTSHTDAQRLKTLRIFIIRGDAAHNGADSRRKFIQPDHGWGLYIGRHNADKISFPDGVSNPPSEAIDGSKPSKCGLFTIFIAKT